MNKDLYIHTHVIDTSIHSDFLYILVVCVLSGSQTKDSCCVVRPVGTKSHGASPELQRTLSLAGRTIEFRTCLDDSGHGVHLVIHDDGLRPGEHLDVRGQVPTMQHCMERRVRLVYQLPVNTRVTQTSQKHTQAGHTEQLLYTHMKTTHTHSNSQESVQNKYSILISTF